MKTFEELEECFRSINEMEEIFKSIVIVACHQNEIQKYTELKDQVFKLLFTDVSQNTDVKKWLRLMRKVFWFFYIPLALVIGYIIAKL